MTTTPITTDGSAVCTNLNADMVDGLHLADLDARFGVASGSLPITGGTVDGPFAVAPTWDNSANTYTGVLLNATDNASAAGSRLLDLQTGGVSRFAVAKDGAISLASSARVSNLNADMLDGLHLTDLDARFGVASGSLPMTGGNLTGALSVAPADPATTNALVVAPTWNNSATAYGAAIVNVTDTASSSASKLLDCQVGGIPKFSVAKDGTLATASTTVVTNLNADMLDGQNLSDLDDRYLKLTGGTLTGTLNTKSLAVTGALNVTSEASAFFSNSSLILSLASYNSLSNYCYSSIAMNRFRGSKTAPQDIVAGDVVGSVSFWAQIGGNQKNVGYILNAVEAISGTNGRSYTRFAETKQDGTLAETLHLNTDYAQFFTNVYIDGSLNFPTGSGYVGVPGADSDIAFSCGRHFIVCDSGSYDAWRMYLNVDNGYLYVDGGYGTFDEHDDAKLVSDLAQLLADKPENTKHYDLNHFENLGITAKPQAGKVSKTMICKQAHDALLRGAIAQLDGRLDGLDETVIKLQREFAELKQKVS
jgi:hypothetical protein